MKWCSTKSLNWVRCPEVRLLWPNNSSHQKPQSNKVQKLTKSDSFLSNHLDNTVGTGPPVGVGIGSLPVTPEINGEIGAMSAESDLAGIEKHKHNKPCDGPNE